MGDKSTKNKAKIVKKVVKARAKTIKKSIDNQAMYPNLLKIK